MSRSTTLHALLGSVVRIERDEIDLALNAFGCAASMFAAYSILRPIRETLGVTSGTSSLPSLFWITFVLMLVAQPVFGALMSRFGRSVVLPRVYGFFAITVVAFYAAFFLGVDRIVMARAYFVWVSVFSLFVVTVFWSLMADVFDRDQAGRLFGFIAGGLSFGGLVGSMLASLLAKPLGTIHLLLVSAALLALAVVFMRRVIAWHERRATIDPHVPLQTANHEGGPWAAFGQVARSPYLLGIAIFVFLLSAATTVLYVEQNRAVSIAIHDPDVRTALFGRIDFAVQIIALAGQLFFFGPLLKRVGFRAILAATPLLMCIAFFVLWRLPGLHTAIAAIMVRRVGEYAFTRPSRDMLFTVVSREEKYKAKNFLDTFVYRGGDAIAASVSQSMAAHLDMSGGAGIVGMIIAGLWFGVAFWLGGRFDKRSNAAVEPSCAPALAPLRPARSATAALG